MLSDLILAIQGRIQGMSQLSGIPVLIEDPLELQEQVDNALSQVGLVILIGQPRWRNLRPDSQAAENKVTVEIAIGEAPTVWREVPALVPGPSSYNGSSQAFYAGLTIGRVYRWVPGANDGTITSGSAHLSEVGFFTPALTTAVVTGAPNQAFTGALWTVNGKIVCSDVAQVVTVGLQAWKPPGWRYLNVQQGDPVPDKKRQLYTVLAETKWILGP
jgi:hypothetical protein